MKVYRVGGVIRDTLLGIESKDVDYVVVGSTPEEMLSLGYSQVGADFPVFLNGEGEEYALARTERKSGNGYHGFDTIFDKSITIEEDLFRRDLTINAMALPVDSVSLDGLVDPYGGRKDLEDKILRHVSEAFSDDPVRVLRLARFHARYGEEWSIDDSTVAVCRKLVESGELRFLTRERVLAEFEKALSEPYTDLFVKALDSFGAYEELFPEFDIPKPVIEILKDHRTATSIMKYAILSVFWIMDLEKFEDRLNVSTHYRQYAKMFKTLIRSAGVGETAVSLLYRVDAYRRRDLFLDICSDSEALVSSTDKKYIKNLHVAFLATVDIGFESLTDSQKELVGAQIGQAIRQNREDEWWLTKKNLMSTLISG